MLKHVLGGFTFTVFLIVVAALFLFPNCGDFSACLIFVAFLPIVIVGDLAAILFAVAMVIVGVLSGILFSPLGLILMILVALYIADGHPLKGGQMPD